MEKCGSQNKSSEVLFLTLGTVKAKIKYRKSIWVDALGNPLIAKRAVFLVIGFMSYFRFNIRNKLRITGAEVLKELPDEGVLFVSNHQTYYADVAAMYHTIFAAKNGFYNSVKNPVYLLNPRVRMYFVAAKETMKAGLLPRIFRLAGSVSIKRTWREAGVEINREVDQRDTQKIDLAIRDGWVITFPQGTTKPFKEGRKGTAHIIKKNEPIVVPITIDGFRRAFDKRGLVLKKKKVELKIRFKEPLNLNYDAPVEDILNQVMDAIEQTEEHNRVPELD